MEEKFELLQTIKLPKNLLKLGSMLPEAMYISSDVENPEYVTIDPKKQIKILWGTLSKNRSL